MMTIPERAGRVVIGVNTGAYTHVHARRRQITIAAPSCGWPIPRCNGTNVSSVSNPVTIKMSVAIKRVSNPGRIHSTMPPKSVTGRELLLCAWAVILFILGYAMGNINQDMVHKVAHHSHGGIGVCESAVFCPSFAPRSLCARWKDV